MWPWSDTKAVWARHTVRRESQSKIEKEEKLEVTIQITERLCLRLIAPELALCSLCLSLINLMNLLFFPLASSYSRLSVFWPLLSFFSPSPPTSSIAQVPMLLSFMQASTGPIAAWHFVSQFSACYSQRDLLRCGIQWAAGKGEPSFWVD